jgi:3-oxoacyl-[acyl-carrier protein] reductase
MELGLRGKVAWVVGGSYGIGGEVSKGLAREGALLAISARDAEKLRKTKEDIVIETGFEPLVISADATNRRQMRGAYSSILGKLGNVSTFVYNPGEGQFGGIFDDTLSEKDWYDNWNINVISFIQALRLLLPKMKEQKYGRVVIVGSASGKQPTAGQLISNVTKGSLLALVKTIAEELAPYNILVNNICPGRFITPRRERLVAQRHEREGLDPLKYYEDLAQTIPMKRLGLPGEIADVIIFMVSERASYITGQSINVDGGLVRSII